MARPIPDGEQPRTVRIQAMITEAEAEALKEWRRQHPDMPTISDAVRMLIKRALGK